ncbi:MAG TPA: BrnT family toxin [Caulobacteraceae bacterium]
MRITFHEDKRARTLAERGLDFADAARVFEGIEYTMPDHRRDYGEARYQTVGYLGETMVMVVWTPRGENRHVISMRKCNEREREKFQVHLD